MQDYQNGEAQKQLSGFDQNNHLTIVFVVYFIFRTISSAYLREAASDSM